MELNIAQRMWAVKMTDSTFCPCPKNKQLGKQNKSAKKRNPLSLKSLDKKLWRIFSRFIRIRDANDKGITRCISCGKHIQVWFVSGRFNQQCHAGHYYNQGSYYKSLKYDEKNVHAQCCHCNTYLEGNKQGYREGIIKRYGQEVIDYLDVKKTITSIWHIEEYELNIKVYQKKLKKLEKEKGLC